MTARARTVFLGSGEFAVPLLEATVRHPTLDVVAAVTAPARQSGRGRREVPTPVAARAAELGVTLLTPVRLRAPDAIAEIEALDPDLLVLADYGQIVPRALLDLPPHAALNLHPSLLPRHRGASPIPAAILAGDRETGVTLMRMDPGLDTGPVIAQRRIPLDGTETTPELERRLAADGAELFAQSVDAWLGGSLPEVPQPADGGTLTRPLRREDGRLDPTLPAVALERQVRALQPWPGSFVDTVVGRVIVHAAQVVPADASDATLPAGRFGVGPELTLGTADGLLRLVQVQPAGGRRMFGQELLRGRRALAGSHAGSATPSGGRPG